MLSSSSRIVKLNLFSCMAAGSKLVCCLRQFLEASIWGFFCGYSILWLDPLTSGTIYFVLKVQLPPSKQRVGLLISNVNTCQGKRKIKVLKSDFTNVTVCNVNIEDKLLHSDYRDHRGLIYCLLKYVNTWMSIALSQFYFKTHIQAKTKRAKHFTKLILPPYYRIGMCN